MSGAVDGRLGQLWVNFGSTGGSTCGSTRPTSDLREVPRRRCRPRRSGRCARSVAEEVELRVEPPGNRCQTTLWRGVTGCFGSRCNMMQGYSNCRCVLCGWCQWPDPDSPSGSLSDTSLSCPTPTRPRFRKDRGNPAHSPASTPQDWTAASSCDLSRKCCTRTQRSPR